MAWNSSAHEFEVFEYHEFDVFDDFLPNIGSNYTIFDEKKVISYEQKPNIRYFYGRDMSNSNVFIKQTDLITDKNHEHEREVSFLTVLSHPNIIQLIDSMVIESYGYVIEPMACEYTFLYLIERNHPFDQDFLIRIIRVLLNIIAYLQSQDVTHGDINPENIVFLVGNIAEILEPQDNLEKHLRLVDFGSAKYRSSKDGNLSDNKFRTTFPPPEYVNFGFVSITYDIWSLGQMIHHIVTTRDHFDYNTDPDFYQSDNFLKEKEWNSFPIIKEITRMMLTFDYQKRPWAADLLEFLNNY